jgi:hypothetical protein
MRQIFLAMLLFLVLCSVSHADELPPAQRLLEIAKTFEVTALAAPPAWASPDAPLLFQAAWLSDLHITDAESLALVKAACNILRDELKPALTFITGDNCALPESMLPPAAEKNLSLRRQEWLRDFLKQELSRPYIIIPGDNWPWEFENVFGSDKQSFTYAGFHFIVASLDQQAVGKEGCLVFNESSWQWLKQELRQNATRPCIFIMHEPAYPPCFLEAGRLTALFDAHPQLLLAMGGHLHLDLEFRRGNWTQWCAPALGRSHRPAFKLLSFYACRIVMNSWEWQANARRFESVCKWQQIEVPEHLHSKAAPQTQFQPENHFLYPPAPRQKVPQLGQRQQEYSAMTMQFILEIGLSTFFPKLNP